MAHVRYSADRRRENDDCSENPLYVDWAEPILAEPLAVKDSHVLIPDAAGTGILWDEKAVKKFAA